jgi:hypothetical protein
MKERKRQIAWWLGKDNALVGEAPGGRRFTIRHDRVGERPFDLYIDGQDVPLADAETLDELQWDAEVYLVATAKVAS